MIFKSIIQSIFYSGIVLFFMAILLYFFSGNNDDYSEFWLIFLINSVFLFPFFFFAKKLKVTENNLNLHEKFSTLINSSVSYLKNLGKNYSIHPADALLFADLMNFLSENILERRKNLEKYEKFILSNYKYLYIFRLRIPKEIENFFINEKIKL